MEYGSNASQKEEYIYFLFNCIVQDEQKRLISMLCCQFLQVSKVIMWGENASAKQTKLLLLHMCSAAGLKLVAYYHNEA